MFVDEETLSRHFPPQLLFESRAEMVRHKSRLLMEARALGRIPLAALLFQQAGGLEELLAATSSDTDQRGRDSLAPTRSDHLVSAATCYVYSGDTRRARHILASGVRIKASAQSFFRQISEIERAWSEQVESFRIMYLNPTWPRVAATVTEDLFGKVVPEALLWPVVRGGAYAGNNAEAGEALKCLIIAYPRDLRYHTLYLSSSFIEHGTSAIQYARTLKAAFPDELGAHVGLLLALLRANEFIEAVDVGNRTLDMIRNLRMGGADPNSMVSMTFAASSVALNRSGHPEEARATLAEAVTRLPKDPELRSLYALALLRFGDLEGAEREASEAAVEVDQETDERWRRIRSHWPHTIAGSLALRRGAYSDAVRFLTVAARRPGRMQARNLNDLGVAQARLGDIVAARASFEAALSVQPDYDVAQRNAALAGLGGNDDTSPRVPADTTDIFEAIGDDLFSIYEQRMEWTDNRLAA